MLQRAGVAAFVILTEPFRTQVERVMTYQRTDRPLPTVTLEHPVQLIGQAEVQRRAEALADAAMELLRQGEAEGAT